MRLQEQLQSKKEWSPNHVSIPTKTRKAKDPYAIDRAQTKLTHQHHGIDERFFGEAGFSTMSMEGSKGPPALDSPKIMQDVNK